MNHLKTVLSLFGFIPFVVQASVPCSDTQSSAQIFLCSKETFEHSDRELNNTYKTLLSMVRKEYSAQPNLGVEYIEKIKLSQRAWLNFRDTNCAVYSFQIDEKSQAYETAIYSCKNDMTRKRIEEFKNTLTQ
ncbi:lysozyme inhibitor LprI family protein [Escherichia albertii]|uniref:lysozyme inhibitor LprI family protein n=1 Tax=Escherichia albertii TaxID=208962 RepID=UPI0011F0D0A2|nr:lysozyme inhibitor LprI family protein [Escherichia albertii]